MTSPGGHVADIHVDVHPEATRFKEELRRALANLDDVQVAVAPDTSGFAAKLRARLGTLPTFSVTVDPDVAGFAAKLRAKLGTLTPVKVAVAPDTSGFAAKLRSELAKLPAVSVQVDPNMAGFAAKVRAAIAAIPNAKIRVDVDDAAALTKLGAVAAAVKALSSASISIDVTATVTGLKDVRAMASAVTRLKAVATGPITIDITANVTGPLRDISRLASAVRSLRTTAAAPIVVDVTVNTTGPLAEIASLNRAIRSLSRNSFIPVSIHVVINPPGVAAELIALHGIISRFRNLNARASVSVGTGSSRAGIQALIAAGIAIAPAIVPAAAAATAALAAIGPAAFVAGAGIGVGLLAFAGVSDAVKAMGAAQTGAAKTGATLANQQKQVAAANDQVKSAAAGVESAERNLAAAQRDALRAQQDINQARRDAADAYEDLNSQATNNALQIRQARLTIADAETELAKVTGLDVDDRRRVEAQLAYDEAKQQLADLTTRQGRLGEEQKEAAKVGIEGSEQVRTAQERAADAQERIRDAEQALTEARRQSVAAQRDLTSAMVTTGATGGAAVDTLAQKMAALSPAGRTFATFIHGLRDEFKAIKGAAEAGLLPGVQAGLEAMLPIFPRIAEFVGRVAVAMGALFKAAGQALASPFWVNFFDYMGQAAGPIMEALGGILGGLARGFASLLVAFTPFSTMFMQGMAGIAQAFADWAAGLATSNGFTAFIGYVTTEGPKVLTLFGALVVSLVKLGIAFAPLGSLILDGLIAFFEFMGRQSPGTLVAIAAGLGAIAIAFALLVGGPITVIVAGITAIAAAAVYAYTKFSWVRTAVEGWLQTAAAWFGAIRTGVETFVSAFVKGGDEITQKGFLGFLQVQAQRLRDTFEYVKAGVVAFLDAFKRGGDEVQQGGFAAYLANVGMVARHVFDWLRAVAVPALQEFLTWLGPKLQVAAQVAWTALETFFGVLNRVFGFLWEHRAVVGAVVGGIVATVSAAFTMIGWHWENVLKPVFTAVVWYVQNFMAPVFMWLWQHVITPVWAGIRFAIDVAWAAIQVTFGVIQIAIKILAGVFLWFFDAVIRPVWERVWAAIQVGWERIRPIFEAFGSFISTHVAPRFAAAVDGLKNIWNGLQEAAKAPIRFIVDTVLNNGLLAAYNTIAKVFSVKPDNVKVDLPRGFARGGPVYGPGTPTSDSIPAMLSNGEYVIPANVVRTFGVSFFDQLIGKKKYPYDNAGEMRFGDGGIVDWAKSAWNTVTDPIGTLKDKAMGLLGKIPNAASQVVQVAVGAGKHLIGGVIDWAKGKLVPKVQSFTAVDTGDTGPGPGFLPWPSGPGGQRGNTGVWRNIMDLVRATGIPFSFGNAYRPGDPLWHGSGRAVDLMGYNQDALASYFQSLQPRVLELIHRTRTRDYGITRGRNRPFPTQWPKHENHIHIAMRHGGLAGRDGASLNVPYLHRDSGGMVPPGLSLVDNRTGKDEWMFNNDQMQALAGATAGRGQGAPLVHIDTLNATESTPHGLAAELLWEMKKR